MERARREQPGVHTRRIVLATLLSAALAACALPGQCPKGTSLEMGANAAYRGLGREAVASHVEQCAEVGRAVDRAAWNQGYEEGLKRYCTVERAYEVGFSDWPRDFHVDRCPAPLGRELAAAFTHGQRCGEIQEDIDDAYADVEDDQDEDDDWAGALLGGLFSYAIRIGPLEAEWRELRCY